MDISSQINEKEAGDGPFKKQFYEKVNYWDKALWLDVASHVTSFNQFVLFQHRVVQLRKADLRHWKWLKLVMWLAISNQSPFSA